MTGLSRVQSEESLPVSTRAPVTAGRRGSGPAAWERALDAAPVALPHLPLQTKLAVNEPGDMYEQEADRVAEQVMRMPQDDLEEGSSVEPVPTAPSPGAITSPARVNAPNSPGWQSVDPQYILIKSGEPVELPHFLLLNYQDDKCAAGKTRWSVREGRYSGHDVCILTSALIAASSAAVGAGATAKFDLGKGQFWYGGTGPIEATTDPDNPVPKGKHDIEIPDFHHDLGTKYGDYATTWFRLGHSGDRYLHPGRISLGCTTIKAISEWPAIWKYLISSRKDHQNVGELEVL